VAALVELRDVRAGFAGRPVLHGIDLALRRGERVAVLGRSGAGKSTLLNLLHARLAADAALVPQAPCLVRTLSVFHNVYMGRLDRHAWTRNLRVLAWPRARERAEVAAVLAEVDLADRLHAQAGTLSGGQQQRVSVARALYNGRPILVGDEPVSALDRAQGAAVLARMAARHDTLILALHDVALALAHADRIVMLDAGRIVLDAPTRGLSETDLAAYYG
jgi:phosphonate transport system ATP-binding protein